MVEVPGSSVGLHRIPFHDPMTVWNFLCHKANRLNQFRRDGNDGCKHDRYCRTPCRRARPVENPSESVVEDVLKGIAEAAAKGEEISLNGFGKFKVQNKPARDGRNPSTGATIKIAASKKIVFQPAKALKDSVNG